MIQVDFIELMASALRVIVVCALVGLTSFGIGELLPRERFDFTVPPYAPFAFERDGRIYERFRVHLWKDRVPDMSKIVRGVFRKKMPASGDTEALATLIRETCVAEFVHMLLILASPVFLFALDGVGGYIAMAVFIAGNLPFIMIQRYNRPRLAHIYNRRVARAKI